MIDIRQGTALALRLTLTKYRHPDYQRTVDLSTMYKAFATGEGYEYMLERFNLRESVADFEQANRLAHQIIKPITSALMKPARKVGGVRPVVDVIDYGKENDPDAQAMRDSLNAFYGGAGMDGYLTTLIDPSDRDPNAFAVLTFDPFDNRFEKPTVYPILVPCTSIHDFQYLNGELQYLWMAFDIMYIAKPAVIGVDGKVVSPEEKAKGTRYVLYLANNHIVLQQIDKNIAPKGGTKGIIIDATGQAANTDNPSFGVKDAYYLITDDDRAFAITFYEQKSGAVPAFRLGCKPDGLTDGRTCVNRWDEATPYLKKSLKHVRELDLSISMHTYLQRIEAKGPCQAKGCNGGLLSDGSECSDCKGTGKSNQASAQDHIEVSLPKNPADAMWDLTKLVQYVNVPIEIVTTLIEVVKQDRSDAFKAVYGADIYSQGNTGKTYEEVVAMNEGMYDALRPLAEWWALTRMGMTKVIAAYMDKAEGLRVSFKLPRSFGFENVATIFDMMKGGTEAGASKSLMANLNGTALDIVFRDDADALLKAQVQARYDPFPGVTELTIVSLISAGKVTDRSAFIWTESATIFRACEAKYEGQAINFYELAPSKQDQVFNDVVDEMIAKEEAKRAAAMPDFSARFGTDDTLEEGDAEEGDNLTGQEQAA